MLLCHFLLLLALPTFGHSSRSVSPLSGAAQRHFPSWEVGQHIPNTRPSAQLCQLLWPSTGSDATGSFSANQSKILKPTSCKGKFCQELFNLRNHVKFYYTVSPGIEETPNLAIFIPAIESLCWVRTASLALHTIHTCPSGDLSSLKVNTCLY